MVGAQNTPATAVDIFCGAGGLTRGLLHAGIPVAAGYDIDDACRYSYEHNNDGAQFIARNVTNLDGKTLTAHYPKGHIRILVGCAPCQPFSKYTQGFDAKSDGKWSLLAEFARLVRDSKPEIVSMENVPELQRHAVFGDFLATLDAEGFHFSKDSEKRVVYCPDYGIAQDRKRLVLVASKLGPIELIPPTHTPDSYRCVRDVLRNLPRLAAGEVCASDPLHRSSHLSSLNLCRIRRSKPGGTWRDWPKELVAGCHRAKSGKTYPSVYGRMEWDHPSPTITTQFYGFGNGRFGHPEQDRALSLREGAILQSFPKNYEFVQPGAKYHFKIIGRLIGNAVPVRLGEVVGRTISRHLEEHDHE
ncbi:MAG: DNA cytosine methyltransferase [Planctomycetota bacterium]|nr:DNA cytosine methyltransferase [Planctomycetota bacterium]